MLNPDSVLSLLHSLWLYRQRSPLPATPSLDEFKETRATTTLLSKLAGEIRELLILPDKSYPEGTTLNDLAYSLYSEWEKGEKRICFKSSGSMGKPKRCLHSKADLDEEADFLKNILPPVTNVVSLAPAHHCYGFMFGLWLPLLLNIPVTRVQLLPGAFFSLLKPDSLGVALPFILEKSKSAACPATLVSATAPLSKEAFARFTAQSQSLIEIFGSSETGVLGWRESPDAPFQLAPHYRRVGNEIVRTRTGTKIILGDKLSWLDKRRFVSLGRSDDVVQVGGINVSLKHVENFVEKHEGVAACAARLMGKEEGNRLKIFIVPAQGWNDENLRKELLMYFRELKVEERPGNIQFGPSLPRNPMGKLCDWSCL